MDAALDSRTSSRRQRAWGQSSGCASCVAMMQPADHQEADDVPFIGRFALADLGGVVAEREVDP